jgi:hypothetical protein
MSVSMAQAMPRWASSAYAISAGQPGHAAHVARSGEALVGSPTTPPPSRCSADAPREAAGRAF